MSNIIIKEFFNHNYSSTEHYWWKEENRYSIDESLHTPYNATIIKLAKKISNGRALDLGAGEGADSIRLAKLGFVVDAVEWSEIAVKKIVENAARNGVCINTTCCDIERYEFNSLYNVVLCNGVLHYIENKLDIIKKMQEHTLHEGINCISLFSTYSKTPDCHKVVPVYPDDEGGIIENGYVNWETVFLSYDREKKEISHYGMDNHIHSFIKIIARR